MVEIAISWIRESKGSETDVVESFVVNAIRLISVLNQLVDREGCVVGFDNGVRHLGGWDNGIGVHDPIWVLLTDLGDEESSHARASATTK